MDKVLASKIADALANAGRFDLLEEAADTTASIVSMMRDGREEEDNILPMPANRHNVARKLDQRAVGSKRYRNLRKEKAMRFAKARKLDGHNGQWYMGEYEETGRLDRNGVFEDADEWLDCEHSGESLDDTIERVADQCMSVKLTVYNLRRSLSNVSTFIEKAENDWQNLNDIMHSLDALSSEPRGVRASVRAELNSKWVELRNLQEKAEARQEDIDHFSEEVASMEAYLEEARKVHQWYQPVDPGMEPMFESALQAYVDDDFDY